MAGSVVTTFAWGSLCRDGHVFVYAGDPSYLPTPGWPCACGLTTYARVPCDDRRGGGTVITLCQWRGGHRWRRSGWSGRGPRYCTRCGKREEAARGE